MSVSKDIVPCKVLAVGQENSCFVWSFDGEAVHPTPSRTLETKSAACAAWNHSYRVAATGHTSGKLTLVGVETGRSLAPFDHGESIIHVQFSSSSKYVAAASASKVSIWDLRTKTQTPTMQLKLDRAPQSLSFDSAQERLMLVLRDGSVVDWPISDKPSAAGSRQLRFGSPDTDCRLRCLHFLETADPDLDHCCACVLWNGDVVVLRCPNFPGSEEPWDVEWRVPASGAHSDADPSSVRLSVSSPPEGGGKMAGCHAFASCAEDGVLNVHSLDRRQHMLQLRVGTPLTTCDFLPGGRMIAAGSSDGVLRILDSTSPDPIATVPLFRGPVRQVFCSRSRRPQVKRQPPARAASRGGESTHSNVNSAAASGSEKVASYGSGLAAEGAPDAGAKSTHVQEADQIVSGPTGARAPQPADLYPLPGGSPSRHDDDHRHGQASSSAGRADDSSQSEEAGRERQGPSGGLAGAAARVGDDTRQGDRAGDAAAPVDFLRLQQMMQLAVERAASEAAQRVATELKSSIASRGVVDSAAGGLAGRENGELERYAAEAARAAERLERANSQAEHLLSRLQAVTARLETSARSHDVSFGEQIQSLKSTAEQLAKGAEEALEGMQTGAAGERAGAASGGAAEEDASPVAGAAEVKAVQGKVDDLHVELLRHQHKITTRLEDLEGARARDAEELRAEVARLREECVRMRNMY